ncbi:MAG: hypothetical protein JSS09_00900 [Verrucomicrobia bacterium]|nr:hypothetical protein [Verrucomicrobiota bacterium]
MRIDEKKTNSTFYSSLKNCNEAPYALPILKIQNLYEYCVVNPVTSLIRPLFFPLFSEPSPEKVAQFKKEEQFFKDFWDPNAPLYPELSHHKEVKDHFVCKNQDFEIVLKGDPYRVKCCIIESKDCIPGRDFCNIIHVLGIYSTVDNTIMHTYPLLTSYLELEGEKPPARFILISQYATYSSDGFTYKPKTLSEAGFILSETLKSIEQNFGTIHQLIAHSLGSIVTAAGLKYFHKDRAQTTIPLSFLQNLWDQIATFLSQTYNSLIGRVTVTSSKDETVLKTSKVFTSLPKNILFDRGPSSIEKLSGRYTGGSILLPLARLTSWDVDIGKEISDFVANCKESVPSIIVINAFQDHRFGGDVNLCSSPEIKKLTEEKKVTSILLDICMQSIHENAQHSYSLGGWYGSHVVEEYKNQSFLQKDQRLSTAIIQKAVCSTSV